MTTRTIEILQRNNIPYEEMEHPFSVTAQQTARLAHISGKRLAKSVVVEIDDQLAEVVLHADESVDLMALKDQTGAEHVRIVGEREFADRFPDCEFGAVPALGNLYGMPVYVSESLLHDDAIVVNPGSHRKLVKMMMADFKRITHPTVIEPTLGGVW